MRKLIFAVLIFVIAGCEKDKIEAPEGFPAQPVIPKRNVTVRLIGTSQDNSGNVLMGIGGVFYLPEYAGQNIDTTITVQAGNTVSLKGEQFKLENSSYYGQIEMSIDTNGTRAESMIINMGTTKQIQTISVAIP